MKQLIIVALLFILSLGMVGCDATPTIKKENIPIEVVIAKENNKFDTILQISDTTKVYTFTNKGIYLGAYVKEFNISGLYLFIQMIVGTVLGIIISIILKN